MSNRRLAPDQLTGPLLRGARALADLSISELAAKTSLGTSTCKRAEAAVGRIGITRANSERLQAAYAEMGIVFISDEEGASGILKSARHTDDSR